MALATLTPLFLPAPPEVLVLLLIAVLLFGANKIPKLARSSGEAIGEFQKGKEEVEQELQEIREGKDADKETTTETAEATASESDDESEEAAESA